MTKKECPVCAKLVTANNFTKHVSACGGPLKTKATSLNCSFCDKEFNSASGTGLHQIQCAFNPNRVATGV